MSTSAGHGRAVFANSCIKQPLNPSSKLPNPSFLVPQCRLYRGLDDPGTQDGMSTVTKKKATSKCPLARTNGHGHQRRTKCCSITHQLRRETDNFQSMVQFYDSIPDYKEMHHLSRDEFYCRLNTLKKKQRELKSICFVDGAAAGAGASVGAAGSRGGEHTRLFLDRDGGSDGEKGRERSDPMEDNESLRSWSKSPPLRGRKGSGGKSVRIDSNKEEQEHTRKYRAGTPYCSEPDDSTNKNASSCGTTPVNSDFVERYDRYVKRSLRCKSASPIRDYSKVTIPQPYKMTQREEEQRTVQDLLIASKSAFPSKETLAPDASKPTQFRANPVPITSRIPLFDTIMADQEYRNRLAKLNSEIELQSQMKPFNFSERFNRPHNRCLSRSFSSPALLTTGLETEPKTFKAKPCPKGLFSNYFYHKAWEDAYFRRLNKRLRAEEMLRQASLPPAMARREKSNRKVCLSRTDSTNSALDAGKKAKRKRKSKKSAKRRKSVEEKCATYFTNIEPGKMKVHYPTSNSSCSNSFDHQRDPVGVGAPAPIYPVNRPNLAATLRTEWCRKKLRELELEEAVTEKRAPRFHWGVKKSQAFQNLNLDHTHEEELSLRLATRRAEQRLRQEEHSINMELMRQRVKAAPLLLEGPPQWGPRLGHVSHRCSGSMRDITSFPKPEHKERGKSHPPKAAGSPHSISVSKKSSDSPTSSHRPNEKRRSGRGSKMSDYSFDSVGKLSYKPCDSDLLSLSDV